MFIPVNRSGFVQFCSLYTGSVLGLVCSDLHDSFSEVMHSLRRGVLPAAFSPAQGYQHGAECSGGDGWCSVVHMEATSSRQQMASGVVLTLCVV